MRGPHVSILFLATYQNLRAGISARDQSMVCLWTGYTAHTAHIPLVEHLASAKFQQADTHYGWGGYSV